MVETEVLEATEAIPLPPLNFRLPNTARRTLKHGPAVEPILTLHFPVEEGNCVVDETERIGEKG